ncbi:MAG: hypothetical protein EPO24_03255 [Bacteroidetes bacterium]|nr:MAG: hypothetical protein EPO24_03255 [Bacteroidota bacterium]
MIKDYQVKIGNVTVPNVQSVTVSIETPSDQKGIYREPTFAATITIVRDASNKAFIDAFGLATNDDGRKNMLTSGSLEFHGDDIKDEYAFNIKRGFVSGWMLHNPTAANAMTTETIELKVGSLEYKAGGGSAEFTRNDFN